MSAFNAAKTVCKFGHSLTDPANVYVTTGITRKAFRQCKACRRNRYNARCERSAVPGAKLDAKQLARMRDARADGVSLTDLASRFGVNHERVKALCAGVEA